MNTATIARILRAAMLTGGLTAAATTASAHDFWVHAGLGTDADSKNPFVMTNIGWGHALFPISEFLAGDRLISYRVVDPTGKALDLPVDKTANKSQVADSSAMPGIARLNVGDPFARRILFKSDAPQGTYQLHGLMTMSPRTDWIDAKGDKQFASIFPDQVKDAQRIVESGITVRSSTAYWPVGAWTAPKSANLPIELLAVSDTSKLKVGQPAVFEVYRDGKPLRTNAKVGVELHNNDGHADGKIDGHKVTFTPPSPGTWLVRVFFTEPLPGEGSLAQYKGKLQNARYITTATFEAKP
ncbi:MAG: DUF4198 domain-containing protein [Alphaproteobacteria bacterium]